MIGIVGIEADCGLDWVFRWHAWMVVEVMHPIRPATKKPGTLWLPGIRVERESA